jgi:Ca2+-binding EF-hand superfamily protein
MVLLIMLIYVVAICVTQQVHTARMDNDRSWTKLSEEGEKLEKYWGNLIASGFTLFESITGGIDWDDSCRPLIDDIGWEVGLLFSFYIMFTVLAMLNVVTGVFIDSVMSNASQAHEQEQIAHVQNLFNKLDIDHSGEITWPDFERQLQQKEMRDFFKTIDVDIDKARSLFDLLDLDDSGSVDVGEFMDGCLRIWAPAKGLDLRMIMRDVNRVAQMLRAKPDDNEEDEAQSETASGLGKQMTPVYNSQNSTHSNGLGMRSSVSTGVGKGTEREADGTYIPGAYRQSSAYDVNTEPYSRQKS